MECCVFIFLCLEIFLKFPLTFFFSLTQWSFKNLLCSFHMLMNSSIFLLLLIFSFIQLLSKKIIGVILFLLSLFRLILWLNMWSTLDNVPHFLDKNVYRHTSFYSSSQTPCFLFVCLFCFYKLRVCVNPALSKPIGIIFPIAFAYQVSLSYFDNSHNISNISFLLYFYNNL